MTSTRDIHAAKGYKEAILACTLYRLLGTCICSVVFQLFSAQQKYQRGGTEVTSTGGELVLLVVTEKKQQRLGCRILFVQGSERSIEVHVVEKCKLPSRKQLRNTKPVSITIV